MYLRSCKSNWPKYPKMAYKEQSSAMMERLLALQRSGALDDAILADSKLIVSMKGMRAAKILRDA